MERWQSRPLARWGFAALLCFALLGLIPSAALAAISLVQQNNGSSASATSLPVPFTTAPTTTAGNVLIMVGGTSTGSLSGVSGGGVGNWFKAQSSTTNTHIEIWYGAVDVATLTSSTPVTITAATAGGMWMTLMEWNGVSLTIDKSAAQAGTSSPASAPSITTTNASDLVILGIADNIGNTFGSPSTGSWTALTAVTTPEAQTTWYSIAAATATFNPTVTETANTWDAAIAALKGCAATTSDASYLTANGQNGVVSIYWASPNPVLILRDTTNSFTTAPTNGNAYKVGDANLGTATIVYSGSGNVAPGTFNQSVANQTWYYKVYTNCDLVYSTGVVLTVAPATTSLWSYSMPVAALTTPGIDDQNVVIFADNNGKVHGADATSGTLEFPVFTQAGGAIQARPTIIPAAYSQTNVNVAYASSQDGYVYALNTATGASVWSNPTACSGTGTRSCVPGSNNLQGGAAVWLQAIRQLPICGVYVDAVFVGSRISGNNTGNSVYALNGGTTPVTSGGGNKCRASGTVVQPGDYLWQFTGASGGTPNMAPINSTPYIDYNNNVVWVTSNAANGLTQPSLWKINVQTGMLANGTTACGTGASTSCWNLGHTDSSPSPSGDGTWIYVGTNCIPAGCATQAATLNAVSVAGGTVQTYNPGTAGSNGTGHIKNPYPMLSTSFGTQSSGVTYVNSKSTAQSSNLTSCAVDMGAGASPTNGLTAGNTVIVSIAVPTAAYKTVNVTDNRGSIYSRRRFLFNAAGVAVELWSATIATGSGTVVTASFGAYSTKSTCAVAQYSGVGAINNSVVALGFSGSGSGTTASLAWPTAGTPTLDTNNRVVAGFAYAVAGAFTASLGSVRTSATMTGLSGAIEDNGTSGGAKAAVTTSATHATGTWVGVAVELRSVAVDQIVYTRDTSPHGIQIASSLFSPVTTTVNPTWQACCPGTISGPVDDGQGRLYFGSSNGKLLQYDAWSGSFGVWNDTTLHPAPQVAPGVTTILGDPSYDGVLNRLYFGGNDGRVYAITPGW